MLGLLQEVDLIFLVLNITLIGTHALLDCFNQKDGYVGQHFVDDVHALELCLQVDLVRLVISDPL